MLAVSQNYKDATESETRNIKARITMKGVTYTNSDIFNVEYNSGSIAGETFNIGSTFSNNIKVTFSSIIEELLLDDQVKLEFGVVLSDSTIEYVKMGTFFITSYDPQRNDFKTVIEASDKMIQLNGTYESELSYPSTIKKVALEIANKAGLLVNETSFARLSDMPINEPIGYTYRQALGLIAQFECGFALFDRNGLLDIRMLSDPEYTVNPDSYFSKGLTKDETNYQIGGINCKVVTKDGDSSETTTLQSGSTSGAQIYLENNVMTQTLLDGMYQKIRTVNYFPFTLNWRGNPALEAGDWITVVDIRGNRFKVPNLNYKLSFSGGLKAVSSANTQTVSASSYQYKGNLQQQIYELSGRIGAAGNHIYDGNAQPILPKEGDLWFKPNGPDTEIRIYQNGEWVFQVSTATNPEIAEAIEQAQTEATEAKTAAQDAVDKANASVAAVQANTQLITDVNAIANNAKSQAQTAATNAQTALTNAQTALDKADGVSSKQTTIETNIDAINGTLSSKANTTDLNALKGRVNTAETNITQNATDIATKASKTDVNTLTGRVTQAESSIKQNADSITQKVSSIDVENILTGKSYATQSQLTQTSNSLTSTISGVKTDLDNMVIGGENLLIDSDIGSLPKVNAPGNRYFSDASNAFVTAIGFKQVSDSPTLSGYVVEATSIGGGSGGRRIAFYSGGGYPPFVKGETYTMSCYARKISGNPKIPFQYGNGTDGYKTSVVDVYSTNWKRYSWTFVYAFDNPSIAYLGGISGLTAGTLQSCGFKVERGNKATSWGLSQYELATVTDLSQLAQDVNGFKQTVASTYLTQANANSIYPTKTTVSSQISQSATEVRQDIQNWTNGQLTNYSTTQQTTSSITNAVASKADKSQITQLSNQVTSAVSNFKNNILDNSDFRNNFTGWNAIANTFSSIVGISTITGLPMKKPTKYIRVNYADLGGTEKRLVQTVNNPSLYAGSKLRMSVYYYGNNAPGDKSFEFYSRVIYNGTNSYFNNGASKLYGKMTGGWNRIDYLVDLSSYDNPSLLTEINININLKGATYSTGWVGFTSFMVTEDGNLYDWSYDYTASTSYSQITQLASDINLRVSKGDVTSQINIEAGRTLIDTKQLLLNADTVKFSGSAFIPDAMIQSITANKITAGTINAANVNVINLNAANITTGTLSGANLSMNLNTGEVLFQKGVIKKTDGSFVIDITNGEISSDDSKGGFSLKSGALKLRRKADNAEYGSINYGFDNDGEWNLGLTIVGNEGYMFKTQNYTSSFSGTRAIIGSGIKSNTTPNLAKINLEAQNGISLFGGKTFDSSSFIVPYFSVGDISSDIIGNAQNIKFYSTAKDALTAFIISPGQIEISAKQTFVWGNFNAVGSKNAIHVTRDGVRATPAYETAESYLGDIGRNYTRENYEVWVEIDLLFSDTVNTDIAYEVFLQAYDNARFWVEDFKPDKFLIKSDKPMARFAWEIKAKRRGYESDRLVIQEGVDNDLLDRAHDEGAL